VRNPEKASQYSMCHGRNRRLVCCQSSFTLSHTWHTTGHTISGYVKQHLPVLLVNSLKTANADAPVALKNCKSPPPKKTLCRHSGRPCPSISGPLMQATLLPSQNFEHLDPPPLVTPCLYHP